jgi:hypothetical protein
MSAAILDPVSRPYPLPVKHRRYPWKRSKGKRSMTLERAIIEESTTPMERAMNSESSTDAERSIRRESAKTCERT